MAAGRVRSPCLPRDYDKNSRSALAGRAPIDPECVRNGRIGIGAGGRREPSVKRVRMMGVFDKYHSWSINNQAVQKQSSFVRLFMYKIV